MNTAALSTLATAPLAVRMRPRSLDEIVGQQHLLRPGSPLRQLEADTSRAVSVILWGPPGTGKTTIAQALTQSSGRKFVELSAVTAGIKDVRDVMQTALTERDMFSVQTVLFLDEIHRFSKSQQDALLPGVENGWVTLIAATTENPSFAVIGPLLSRSLQLTLQPLTDTDLATLINRAVSSPTGLADSVRLTPEALAAIVQLSAGDARRALTSLEAVSNTVLASADSTLADDNPATTTGDPATRTNKSATITAEHVSSVVDRALLRYDKNGDQHYDVISAFIKSIRGSNPDAALHYLARMIVAGEDPRFIARRLIVHAAEDIGMADPQALLIASAAAEAAQLIGLPEARIPLAEATIYLALAPKSNAVISAIDTAIADVKSGRTGQIPAHLRDGHYPGARKLGHAVGYRYPHANRSAIVRQQYLPDTLRGIHYYAPTPHGNEAEVMARLRRIREIIGD
ncbi:replication-associated recombination protein A [Canibacter sp. lx-72]|uniref:replication-associated recombination protein A n=1 Tax=Canibacter zhuwentaonis TaxID=2837491 RepID=UPI001BDCA003|nr:replication-associated recombination protein A [Canibacter zhuwentaonis]MBT1017882.1 replication-associated recombination protein A [Canibacter zhuwentaonis]MBT1035045.1 replication-associated recombination protein A [Canibacter zhuwentaonis]